jgi:hypothetical protein
MDQDNNEIYKFIVCVTSTGITGLALPGDQMAHFFLLVPLDATLGLKLGASSKEACPLQDTQMIIWDESTHAK